MDANGTYRIIGIRRNGQRVTIASCILRDDLLDVILDMPLGDDPFCGLQVDQERAPTVF